MDIREHWERIYRSKSPTAVGWYEPDPATSLAFIGAVALRPDAAIVDVGGGASLLIDRLLDSGFTNLTVVDVSVQALAAAQGRLDARAKAVQWVDADVRHLRLPHPVDIWHDRGASTSLPTLTTSAPTCGACSPPCGLAATPSSPRMPSMDPRSAVALQWRATARPPSPRPSGSDSNC